MGKGKSRRRRKYPCPCCGHLMFTEPPGSNQICEICFWEDDDVHLRDPLYAGGANEVSLCDAQRNYAGGGACEPRFKKHVRPPGPRDAKDPDWRPVDIERDKPDR